MDIKIFNVDFDGIDKCGKETIRRTIISYYPNKYIYNDRGILSQIAFAKMFKRDFVYKYTKEYFDNSLIVYLTVDKDDWEVRCDITRENIINENRRDVEGKITYEESVKAFDEAWQVLLDDPKIDNMHLLKINTSKKTPIQIAKEVVERLDILNNF